MKIFRATIIIVVSLLTYSCSTNTSTNTATTDSIPIEGIVLADTIIYDVTIAPQDTLNAWEVECLSGVNQDKLIDYIFSKIYSGQFVAYSFSDEEQLSTNEVQKIEQAEGFNRNLISKIQFKEMWFTDTCGNFKKEILEMTLGYATYSNQNTFLGHRGLFKIKVNNQ